jgi:hypothetical protein
MWFKVYRNVNDIRKQIIVFTKKHIIILFTHKSIHNSDKKDIKYRIYYPCWATSLVVNKQFWSIKSNVCPWVCFCQNWRLLFHIGHFVYTVKAGKSDITRNQAIISDWQVIAILSNKYYEDLFFLSSVNVITHLFSTTSEKGEPEFV